jgi:hypothetical protein
LLPELAGPGRCFRLASIDFSWRRENSAALFHATFFGFVLIPEGDNLPAHWNISGAIDQYGPRSRVLIVLPLSAVVVAAWLLGIEIGFRRMKRGDVSRQFALALSVILALFAAKQRAQS